LQCALFHQCPYIPHPKPYTLRPADLCPRVQKGITVEQMEEFLMSIKIERELSDALKLAHANSTTVRILSVTEKIA
jgi:hypothetical protein